MIAISTIRNTSPIQRKAMIKKPKYTMNDATDTFSLPVDTTNFSKNRKIQIDIARIIVLRIV